MAMTFIIIPCLRWLVARQDSISRIRLHLHPWALHQATEERAKALEKVHGLISAFQLEIVGIQRADMTRISMFLSSRALFAGDRKSQETDGDESPRW